MARYKGVEQVAVEMLDQAIESLKSAAGHMNLAGQDSPAADYLVETDTLIRQVTAMSAQFRREVLGQ